MEVKELEYIASLIEKHLRGTLTEEEKKELEAWLQQSEKNPAIFKRICSEDFLSTGRERELGFDTERAFRQFIKEAKPVRKRRWLSYGRYVAALVILLTVGGIWMWQSVVREQSAIPSLLAPGCPMARLTLADGRVVELTEAIQDTFLQGKVELTTTGKSLSYKAENNLPAEGYNELEVPRKGEFFLILSDGTKVLLNSGTRLRYPVCFAATERVVEMEGEAYFEVRKDSRRPFRVKMMGKGVVEVTGTAFNVHHYQEEGEILVTLVEGKVNLSAEAKGIELCAGEQGYIVAGEVGKRKVNTTLYTAWKDGRFVFKEQTLEEIMRTLSRWYDLDIVFTDEQVRKVTFSGNLRRYDEFGKIIRMLESIRVARFEVKGNHINVGAY